MTNYNSSSGNPITPPFAGHGPPPPDAPPGGFGDSGQTGGMQGGTVFRTGPDPNQPGNAYSGGFGGQYGGSNYYAGQLTGMGNQMMGQQAPDPNANQFSGQLGADAGQFAQVQQAQQGQLAQLFAQSRGQGPNPAADQIAAGTQQAQAQQQALAHSQGIGGAGALAARNAQTNAATLGIQGQNQTALVGAQQQAAAAQQYQQLAAQMAQQGQQQQYNNQGFAVSAAQMQSNQQAQNAANQLALYQQGLEAQKGELAGNSQMASSAANAGTAYQMAENSANNALQSEAIGGAAQGLSSVATAAAPLQQNNLATYTGGVTSDARAKDDIRPIGHSLADKFLDYLHPYSFKYKRPEDEPAMGSPTGGQYMGVMAQDVERVPGIGKQLVKDTPRGKMLSTPATMAALAAGVGRLNERLKMLEGK